MSKGNITKDESEEVAGELSPEQIQAQAKLRKMIQDRGIKPLTAEQLRAMGDVWPEDESVDDFLAAREKWRQESLHRDLT
ncbi:MAG TPA: hypothetical protein VLR90_02435 [Blastocatellia bacterium]|nr:hypothetical protein [Blastocatellia bacterium]